MGVRVILENRPVHYMPSDKIGGYVEVDTTKLKRVTKVAIRFKGETFIKWNANENQISENKNSDVKKVGTSYSNGFYTAEQIHLNERLELHNKKLTKKKNKNSIVAIFSFNFQLPLHLPASLECKFGKTRYYAQAEAFYGPWFSEYSPEENIPVCNIVDLNELTDVENPLEIFYQGSLSTNVLERLVVLVRAPVCGFVPGQVIPFTIQSVNTSPFDVKSVHLQIIRRTHYTSQNPDRDTRKVDTVMKEWICGIIEKQSRKNWTYSVVIPRLVPSGMNACAIFDVDYYVKVICKIPDANQEIKIIHQVVIAVIPLLAPIRPMYTLYDIDNKA